MKRFILSDRSFAKAKLQVTSLWLVAAIIVIAITACTKKSETTAVITAESYAKILNGDLSDFAGYWVNGNGEKRQLRADGVFADGSINNLTSSGFNEYNGTYFWGVYQDHNGFQVTLYPVGVPIELVNEGMGFGETIESDITKVRIIGSNVVQNGEVYYREGQAPTAETLAAQRQATTRDQTKDGQPKTMYVTSPDGLRGRTEPSLMGSVVKAFAYGQMIAVSEKSSTPTFIDGILDYWYLTSFSGDDVWLFGGYLSDSLPVEKSSDTAKDRITVMDVVRNDEVYYQPDYQVQFKGETIYMTFTLLPQMSGNTKIGDILTYLNFVYKDKQQKIDLEYLGPISYTGPGSINISAGDYNSDGHMDLTLNGVIVLYNTQTKSYPMPNDPYANYSPQGVQ